MNAHFVRRRGAQLVRRTGDAHFVRRAGETRQNLPLSSGTAAPLAPEKAELLMRRLMGKENLEPTSNQQSTSGGMDTMEYPL